MNNYKKLLSCWHKLEHFSSADIPKSKDTQLLNGTLPWTVKEVPSSDKNTIEYTLYLAVFSSSIATDFVKKIFNDTEKEVNIRSSKVCMASLKVDLDGCYVSNSFGISTLPWAIKQLQNNKIENNSWADEFNALKNGLLEELEYNLNGIISLNSVLSIQEKVFDSLSWTTEIEPEVYIKREEKFKSVRKPDEEKNNAEILNSFYIDDIGEWECKVNSV